MNLNDISTVLAVYQYSSFTEAAYLTFQSLSAVSKCVSRVESEIGGQLFVRSRNGMHVTAFGEKAIPLLAEMHDAHMRAEETGRRMLSSEAGNTLTVGYTPLLGTIGENELLLRLRRQDDSVRIVQVKRFGNMLQQLMQYRKQRYIADLARHPVRTLPYDNGIEFRLDPFKEIFAHALQIKAYAINGFSFHAGILRTDLLQHDLMPRNTRIFLDE